jgi:hypothetical protein
MRGYSCCCLSSFSQTLFRCGGSISTIALLSINSHLPLSPIFINCISSSHLSLISFTYRLLPLLLTNLPYFSPFLLRLPDSFFSQPRRFRQRDFQSCSSTRVPSPVIVCEQTLRTNDDAHCKRPIQSFNVRPIKPTQTL